MFPAAIGLAATWNTALMGQVAAAIARETKSRGIRQVLSPVVNIADDVRWGRVEETYGEDPMLSSAMATAYVPAFEKTRHRHHAEAFRRERRRGRPRQLSDRRTANASSSSGTFRRSSRRSRPARDR